MADWPEVEELKQVLDITSEDWDGEPVSDGSPTRLSRVLAAAISKVKKDVGNWDEMEDEPDDDLAQAALTMAVLMSERPNVRQGVLELDPAYSALLQGHRRQFGVA